MINEGSFKNSHSNDLQRQSNELFQQIDACKESIYHDMIKQHNVMLTRPTFCHWIYDLSMTLKQERDIHAHLIGKEYRLMQWNAHLYSLDKQYDECSFELMRKMSLQYECIEKLNSLVRPGPASLAFHQIEKIIQKLAELHKSSAAYFMRRYRPFYPSIPPDDLYQTIWVVLMTSLRKFDVSLGCSFILYFNTRLRLALLRYYKNDTFSMDDVHLLKYVRLEYMLRNQERPYEEDFIKKCTLIFNEDFDTLIQEHERIRKILSPMSMTEREDTIFDHSQDMESQIENNDSMERLQKALLQLDDVTRRVLLREEHPDDIDISSHRVKYLRKKGMRILRKIMVQEPE